MRKRRSAPRTSEREIAVCAQCHSRRAQIGEGYVAGNSLTDHYLPSLLMPGLYHADGQQRDEVYTYGSFLQSRMFAAGVTCADCHEPHSGRLRAEGNTLCGQCHTPRNLFGALKTDRHLAGVPGEGGARIPNLTPTRLGKWSDAELQELLLAGITPDLEPVNATMSEVIDNTTSKLTPEDLAALIAYLRTVPPLPE